MSEVSDTPDMSIDESFQMSTSIIDTSLIEQDLDESVGKNISGKKNKAIIESDSSDSEVKIEDVSMAAEKSAMNISSCSSHSGTEENPSIFEQTYRSTSPIISSRSPSPEDSDVQYISSDNEADSPAVQTALLQSYRSEGLKQQQHQPSRKKNSQSDAKSYEVQSLDAPSKKKQVTSEEYRKQKEKLSDVQINLNRMKNCMQTIDVSKLPDKGAALLNKYDKLLQESKAYQETLDNMVVSGGPATEPLKNITWERLQNNLSEVQPRTFGKQAMETLNYQKSMTLDRLKQLHESLKTCPTVDYVTTDPKGLKVELLPHQKYAVAWLMWREEQKPSGGILADDMGLGKTLTMISLALKVMQTQQDENAPLHTSNSKYMGGTLVVCPASLIYQWEAEIKKHVRKGLLTVELYHGAARETKAKRLAKHDFVLTTYALAMGDHSKSGPLFGIKWRRVILDEAHQIRNHKSQTSMAACSLSAVSRWALTGTPIHNKELDMYSLLKFLRCSPFDDLPVWKRWVAGKGPGGQDRLNTITSSLLLRRTKQQLEQQQQLTCLPKKKSSVLEIALEKQEMDIYQKVLIFSRTLFAHFLHQRAEKDTHNSDQDFINNPNSEYFKMHQRLVKLNKVKPIKQHEILVLLLRLRQICCHPSLITNMLQGDDYESFEEGHKEEMNLLEQLNKLNLEDEDEQNANVASNISDPQVGLAEASRNLLNPSHPVFAESRKSTKVNAIMEIMADTPVDEKIIIISQWTKMLNLISIQLNKERIIYYQLDGSVPVSKRIDIVTNFNNRSHKTRILLLSLAAGGVGLNLVGANNLILTDLHWNPQLEKQAEDRIFRVGQTRAVKIYKLIAVDTIEQKIQQLQQKKLDLAEKVLTGARIQELNKLSLEDLKMLFNM